MADDRRGGGGRRGIDVLHDELIEEILLRIPCCITLLSLPAVCKRWRSITGRPSFRHFHQIRSARHSLLMSRPCYMTRYCREGHFRKRSFTKPASSQSCHGLVCLEDSSRFELYNPITGESLVLPPLDGYKCWSTVALGFHPPTNKYKAVVSVDDTCCHVLTVGSGAWRTIPVPELEFPTPDPPELEVELGVELELNVDFTYQIDPVPFSFCYNGVFYQFFQDCLFGRTITSAPLLTYDLGSEAEEFSVHYGSCKRDEVAGDPVPAAHHECPETPGFKYDLDEIIRLHDFGRTVDFWWKDDSGSYYKEFSFKIELEEEKESARGCTTTAAVAPLFIRRRTSLICDDEGLRLYHDLTKNMIEGKICDEVWWDCISLHAGTVVPLRELI